MKASYGMVLLLCCNAAAESRFADIAQSAGVDFIHRSGAAGARYLPETYGSGAAFLDFDGDGALDLYLVNAGRLPQLSDAPEAANALFRNEGVGRFSEQTARAGVGDRGYGMGAVVGDYDNDGWADLYVTNFGPNALFHNRGEGALCRRYSYSQTWAARDGGRARPLPMWISTGIWTYSSATTSTIRTEDPLVCRIGNSEERLYCDPRKFDGQVRPPLYQRGARQRLGSLPTALQPSASPALPAKN